MFSFLWSGPPPRAANAGIAASSKAAAGAHRRPARKIDAEISEAAFMVR